MEEDSNAKYDDEFKMSDFESISNKNESGSDVADQELNIPQDRKIIVSIQELLKLCYVCQ